jgi:TPR repeat protein/serine/threonine protein kinase
VGSPLDALLARPPEERRLGPYLLEAQLGRGGFAPVWKAREIYGDTEVRAVALKIFPLGPLSAPSSSSGSSPPSRHGPVVREARALCRVEHPGVVRFYTLHLDDEAGLLGLVMEYLDGRSLEQRLRTQGPLSAAEAIDLGLQLASALRAVHEAGLVHRDLKPANVIEVRGAYKLIDFGIATHEAPTPSAPLKRVVLDDLPFEVAGTRLSFLRDAPTLDGTLPTAPGPLASGTVGYMDPHSIATGAPATPSSDLYGLGVVLFESLTGRLPSSASSGGLRGEILDGRAAPDPLSTLSGATPAPLARLVDALLCPEREGRPPSAAAVEEALREMIAPPSPPALPSALPTPSTPPAALPAEPPAEPPVTSAAPERPRRRWGLTAAVAAVAVALGIGLWRWSPEPACAPGATAACAARCERGERASCHTLGLMYERASGVPKDELRAAHFFEKACEQGHGAACYALGAMREQGRGGKLDPVEARKHYERACARGDAQGCNGLAIQLLTGLGGDPDPARAVQLFERACEGGYPNGCTNLGGLHERGEGVPRDEAKARRLFERACAEGAPSSCGMLALALLAGRGGQQDPTRATELFERACGGGHTLSCVGFGVMLEQGNEKRPPDRERAARLYRQACDEGERQGCLHLGQLYQRGEGVPLDEVQAFVLFQRACERGHPLGCRLAGEATATGRGVLRDDSRAAVFFRKACRPEEGSVADAEGCAWLAVHLREGRGVRRDPEQAEELRQRACELGATLGCAAGGIPSAPAPSYSGEVPSQVVQPPGSSNLHR